MRPELLRALEDAEALLQRYSDQAVELAHRLEQVESSGRRQRAAVDDLRRQVEIARREEVRDTASRWRFSRRSLGNLAGVHPDLVAVAHRALELSPVDFGISEGVRTLERQRELVAAGSSWTMRSRHLTGHAIDVFGWVDGRADWSWPLYEQIALAFKGAAEELGYPIIWGGDWQRLRDGPHYELDRARYPA
jgi:peptidoglycan L-alanyl-D-glutamate endopeptidase CwlK